MKTLLCHDLMILIRKTEQENSITGVFHIKLSRLYLSFSENISFVDSRYLEEAIITCSISAAAAVTMTGKMNDFVIIVTGLKSLVLDINVTIHCAGEVAFTFI